MGRDDSDIFGALIHDCVALIKKFQKELQEVRKPKLKIAKYIFLTENEHKDNWTKLIFECLTQV